MPWSVSSKQTALGLGTIATWSSVALMLFTGAFLDNFRLFFLFWAVTQVSLPATKDGFIAYRGAR